MSIDDDDFLKDSVDETDDSESVASSALEESSGDDSNEEGGSPAPTAPTASNTVLSDEDEDYSSRVRKRIGKEVYLRKSAEEREAREARRNAELTAELAALREGLEEVKTRNAAADARAAEGTLQAKLQAARQRLLQAKQDQDFDAELAARDEYDELKAEERELRRRPSQQQEASPGQKHAPTLPIGTAKWLQANPWFTGGQHPHMAALASSLDVALQQEGYTPDDPATYAELNRRLRAAAPKAAAILGDIPNGAKTRKPDPGPPSGISSPDGNAVAGARRLTRDDLTRMEQYGFDPNDKEARRVWLATHA